MDLLRLGARGDVGFVGKIVGAEDDEVRIGKADAGGDLRAHDDGHAHVAGHVAGFVESGLEPWRGRRGCRGDKAPGTRAAAWPVRSTSPCVGGSEDDALSPAAIRFRELLDERGNGAVEAQRRPRVYGDFAERSVFVEHVDGAELIEVEAGMRFEECPEGFRGGDRCLQGG